MMQTERHEVTADAEELPDQLRHVYWIGGASGAGKSTIARRVAAVDSRRGPKWGFLGKTSDPERALRNLLERDVMFTHRLYEEAKRLELNIIEVDTTMTVDNLTRQVTEAFVL
jgi:adenylylsulfate kinase-like enzyme